MYIVRGNSYYDLMFAQQQQAQAQANLYATYGMMPQSQHEYIPTPLVSGRERGTVDRMEANRHIAVAAEHGAAGDADSAAGRVSLCGAEAAR